jgi:MFS family permease
VLQRPREDLLAERRIASTDGDRACFEQAEGPFTIYRREVAPVEEDGHRHWRETTRYHLAIPWFGWLFAIPVRAAIARRGAALSHTDHHGEVPPTPWWAPPDRLDTRAISVLGLLAAASMASAFVNTLFSQTVEFAADDFGMGDIAVGVGGSIVRAGILLVLPVAVVADRLGRRRVVIAMAVAAPLVTASGALAPTFPFLVATQALGRPMGLALDFLIAVVAAEEMPRSSRAYAVSLLAMASGLGAGVAVLALPLADLSPGAWRWVYAVALIWLVVAVDIARRLPETRRFARPHVVAPPLDRSRFAVLSTVAMLANFFVAPASLFQNGYLEDARGFSATSIAVFTVVTATPAGVGLIIGGRIADIRGRRQVIALGVPIATALVVLSYAVGGPLMWFSVFAAGVLTGVTVPALAVYRTELFPTGNRSLGAGLLTAGALLGGIAGLLLMGTLLDRDWSHARVVATLALSQAVVVTIVLRWYPETAHRELEELNPVDEVVAPPDGGCRHSDVPR